MGRRLDTTHTLLDLTRLPSDAVLALRRGLDGAPVERARVQGVGARGVP